MTKQEFNKVIDEAIEIQYTYTFYSSCLSLAIARTGTLGREVFVPLTESYDKLMKPDGNTNLFWANDNNFSHEEQQCFRAMLIETYRQTLLGTGEYLNLP